MITMIEIEKGCVILAYNRITRSGIPLDIAVLFHQKVSNSGLILIKNQIYVCCGTLVYITLK